MMLIATPICANRIGHCFLFFHCEQQSVLSSNHHAKLKQINAQSGGGEKLKFCSIRICKRVMITAGNRYNATFFIDENGSFCQCKYGENSIKIKRIKINGTMRRLK